MIALTVPPRSQPANATPVLQTLGDPTTAALHAADAQLCHVDGRRRLVWIGFPPHLLDEARALTFDQMAANTDPSDRPALQTALEQIANDLSGQLSVNLRPSDRPGRWHLLRLRAHHGQARGVMLDVTNEHQALADLDRLAFQDPLTELPNRAAIHQRGRQLLEDLRRTTAGFSVLMLDLCRFKEINDTWGHHAGDATLTEVARRIRRIIRRRDLFGRLGGDEFVVLATTDRRDKLRDIADRIHTALLPPLELDGASIQMATAVGIAIARSGDSFDTVLERADSAMYTAKARGPANTTFNTSDVPPPTPARLSLEDELRTALEQDRIVPLVAPITHLDGHGLFAVELTLAWRDQQGAIHGPGEWLLVAEETGLVTGIHQAAFGQLCAAAARWRHDYGSNAPLVSTNVSRIELLDERLADHLAQTAFANQLPTTAICLEVAERDINLAGTCLTHARRLGFKTALDGLCAATPFNVLADSHYDIVKLDPALLHGDANERLVHGLLGMAGGLQLTTIAAGVDHQDQQHALKRSAARCRFAQGELYGRPLTLDQFTAQLDTYLTPLRAGLRSPPQ